MGAFALPEITDDPFLRNQALSVAPSSTSEVLKSSFLRGFQEGGISLAEEKSKLALAQESASPLLTPEDANKQYGIPGHLTFDTPIKSLVAEQLNRHKVNELSLAETLSSNHGRLTGLAGWGAEQAGNMFDPANAILFSIPYVGEARYLQLASKVGKIPARFAVGAAANAIAVGAVEPLSHEVANLYGEERTVGDSVKRVLSAGAFGGALHVGFGAVGDVARRFSGIKDPVEIYKLQKQLEREASTPGSDSFIGPMELSKDVQEASVKAALAQADRGEIVSAPVDIAALDDHTLTQRAIAELHSTGKWNDILEPGDAQLSRELYARRFPEQVKPIEPLKAVPEILSEKEIKSFAKDLNLSKQEVTEFSNLNHEQLVNQIKELSSEYQVALKSGASEKDISVLQKKVDFTQEILNRYLDRDTLLRQQEFALNYKDFGTERSKVVEKALVRGEPIPYEVMLDHPELIQKYGGKAEEAIVKAEARRADFNDALQLKKTELSKLELDKLSTKLTSGTPQRMSDELVKLGGEPVKTGEGGRTVEDFKTEVNPDKELAKFEAGNKEILTDFKEQIPEAELLKSEEDISFAKKFANAAKVAAECVINFYGIK